MLAPILGARHHASIIEAMADSVQTPEYSLLRSALVSARNAAGLTQRELAARLRVPPSWVAKVELGDRRIDLVEYCWFVLACDADPFVACERLMRNIKVFYERRSQKRRRRN